MVWPKYIYKHRLHGEGRYVPLQISLLSLLRRFFCCDGAGRSDTAGSMPKSPKRWTNWSSTRHSVLSGKWALRGFMRILYYRCIYQRSHWSLYKAITRPTNKQHATRFTSRTISTEYLFYHAYRMTQPKMNIVNENPEIEGIESKVRQRSDSSEVKEHKVTADGKVTVTSFPKNDIAMIIIAQSKYEEYSGSLTS